jgi:hypothetical protein
MSMTVAVIFSLLIGIAAAGLGLWDLHKINKINGQIASVDFSVPATSIISPTNGQTISGVFLLDARALGNDVTGVQFVATGGSSHSVLIANGASFIGGWGANWNSANLPNGTYRIWSVGYSANGRSSRSPAVTVHVQNR